MKVVITATPEVSVDFIETICEILTVGITSHNTFKIIQPLKIKGFNQALPDVDINNPGLLKFEDYFRYCQFIRDVTDKIKDEEFVVLLTTLTNDSDYFSKSDDNKNILVDMSVIERIAPNNLNYAVAHQILATLLHYHIKQNTLQLPNYHSVHEPSIGCLMDYCDNLEDVKIKINAGYICPDCVQKSIDNGVKYQELANIFDVLQSIRSKVMLEEFYTNLNFTPNIKVLDSEVYIEDEKVKLTDMTLLLYLLMLDPAYRNIGLVSNDFSDDSSKHYARPIAEKIYVDIKSKKDIKNKKYIDVSDNNKYIKNLFNKDFSQGSFKDLRLKINKILSTQFGQTIASQYQIQRHVVGYDNKYFIRCFFNPDSINPND